TLVFAAGETSQTISVSIVGDALAESEETFSVTLTEAANASLDVATAVAVIQNDDGALRVQDASLLEGHAGPRSLSFPVSLVAPSILPITVDFTVVGGTATAGVDYRALASGTLSFGPGETTQLIEAEVFGDTIVEGNETFSVVLSNATNAGVDDATALGTILNDDVTIRAPRRATFIDVDGDLVTVTTDQGSFTAENFVLVPAGTGFQLALVTIVGEGAFHGANIEISAERVGAGDGFVHVGAMDARGIGLAKVVIDGDLGQIDAGSATRSGVLSIEARSLGVFGTATQLPGGGTDSVITGTLGKLKLTRDMSGATIDVSKSIRGVSIRGSLLDGAIRADGQIGHIKIAGDVRGTAGESSEITARGEETPASKKEALAIRALRVGGSLEHADILAGYDRTGAATNGAVRIGKVVLGGNWLGSNLVAGAVAGDDGLFGTEDDALIPAHNAVISRIASVLIKGEVVATQEEADHFGIVAGEIAAARNGERTIALAPGPGNDLHVRAGAAEDVRIMEIEVLV
ncbi:MAG TPA: Calx-beta domain-containing protein, partial [Chthoniobacteraceae bacterium]|nr:Calx-beta domain-containing protein [Chthoniobacteraceae bacterium]